MRVTSLVQVLVRSSSVLAVFLLIHTQLPARAAAQTAAVAAALPLKPDFNHHLKITAVYAPDRDTTTVSVVLNNGQLAWRMGVGR